jgi:hypothetical protein
MRRGSGNAHPHLGRDGIAADGRTPDTVRVPLGAHGHVRRNGSGGGLMTPHLDANVVNVFLAIRLPPDKHALLI